MGQSAARGIGSALPLAFALLLPGALASFLVSGCDGPAPSRAQPIAISTPQPTPTAQATPTQAPLRVHVSGAVRAPDCVYRLPPGSIVEDAIEAAGGATADADLQRINLAKELSDQQHVHVPRQGEQDPPPAVSGGEMRGNAAGLVNVNTATQAELETLPRIGPVTAASIVAYREANGPFARIEDIVEVPGIGPATLEQLRGLITTD